MSAPSKHLKETSGIQCPQCPKKLKNIKTWKKHIDTIHGAGSIKKYECLICFAKYGRMDNFKVHAKKHLADGYTDVNCRLIPNTPAKEVQVI